ncbi:MAG: hypothetical protein U1E52_10195 [Geminicoccaceae bacterium]
MFRQAGIVLALALIVAPGWAMPAWSHGTTERVSVSSSEAQGNDGSAAPAISAAGRFVAFDSGATNLVRGDTNGRPDVFVRDRQTGKTERMSISSSGSQSNGGSIEPVISADGRIVAFWSDAANLVTGDTNNKYDVFAHDRQTGKTERMSVSSSGAQSNGYSLNPAISADGRFVAFQSDANNLVPGDTNGEDDIFVHDRHTSKTQRVSISSGGAQGNWYSWNPTISADGRYVAFESVASNLVPADTNGTMDIFVHDRQTGQTRRVSISSSGAQGNGYSTEPAISADGRFVSFNSDSSNLVPVDTNGFDDIFVHDRQTGKTQRVSISSSGTQGNDFNYGPTLSANGRFVAFYSLATNLVPGDTNDAADVFVHDRRTGTTRRVSLNSSGAQGNRDSFSQAISADGRLFAFVSSASNLAPGDSNNVDDIFVRTLMP